MPNLPVDPKAICQKAFLTQMITHLGRRTSVMTFTSYRAQNSRKTGKGIDFEVAHYYQPHVAASKNKKIYLIIDLPVLSKDFKKSLNGGDLMRLETEASVHLLHADDRKATEIATNRILKSFMGVKFWFFEI